MFMSTFVEELLANSPSDVDPQAKPNTQDEQKYFLKNDPKNKYHDIRKIFLKRAENEHKQQMDVIDIESD